MSRMHSVTPSEKAGSTNAHRSGHSGIHMQPIWWNSSSISGSFRNTSATCRPKRLPFMLISPMSHKTRPTASSTASWMSYRLNRSQHCPSWPIYSEPRLRSTGQSTARAWCPVTNERSMTSSCAEPDPLAVKPSTANRAIYTGTVTIPARTARAPSAVTTTPLNG